MEYDTKRFYSERVKWILHEWLNDASLLCVCVYVCGHSDSVEEHLVTVDRLDLDMDKYFKGEKKWKKEKNMDGKTLREVRASEKFHGMYPRKFNS